ncbi:MAG: hypothetical protein U1A27_05730 [Phycisphaerae bacterium]
MHCSRRAIRAAVLVCSLTLASAAQASFHFMQTEQVVGGVSGDVSAQAIQFRMRLTFQNQLQNGRYIVRDGSGANPILLAAPAGPVPNQGVGVRVLFATPGFAAHTSPPAVPDYTMNAIPPAYLAKGSLTFEDAIGTIYWRLSWGGAAYTGPGAGSTTNDADGNFSPPFGSGLPFTSLQALLFGGAAGAMSTNNLADYSVTGGAAVFRNNAGTAFTLIPPPPTHLTLGAILSPQTVGSAFNVLVESRDASNNLANVAANTNVSLSATGGASAALGGTTAGTISAGSSSTTIVGVTYSVAETITVTATRTAGDVLAAGTSNSVLFIPACVLRGDLDGNGQRNGDDVNLFTGCYINNTPLLAACGCADENADGAFTPSDITTFVGQLLSP